MYVGVREAAGGSGVSGGRVVFIVNTFPRLRFGGRRWSNASPEP